MKKWVEKLIEQFDFQWSEGGRPDGHSGVVSGISDEKATLLFIIDTYNKHLLEVDGHPVRKVRETLDEFAKELINGNQPLEKVLFRFRQFFSAYRIDESAFIQKTFEDFRTIIWDFVDQLAEDLTEDQKDDFEVQQALTDLKEAVESNSIAALKKQSRTFIDSYMEKQFKRDKRRKTRMKSIRKNLNAVKKQLSEASTAARTDHLTGAFNRRTFDEYCAQHWKLFQASKQPISLMYVDIDHFKRINDTHGHDVGDFVLRELVASLKSMFNRESDILARIGGEEFAIILPDFQISHAQKKAEDVLNRVRSEVYVHQDREIRFTVSIGIAELAEGETADNWIKRCDQALYASKNGGRNRATVAPSPLIRVA